MLSIGAFSKISGVTSNTLRFYDEIELIEPAFVNRENGYRYYEVSQLETILLINKLKNYGLSLEEISEILKNPGDTGLLLTLMKKNRGDMVKTVQHLSAVLKQLDQDIMNLERGIPIMSNLDKMEVQVKEIQPGNILFVRKKMSTKDYGLYLSQLYKTVIDEKLTVTGDPMTIFHVEQDFDPECYDNEIAIPVKETTDGTRKLPGGLCAVITLNGPYTELPGVYTKLNQWMEKEKYTLTSEPYEVYLTDPGVTPPEENITQVYYPVKRCS